MDRLAWFIAPFIKNALDESPCSFHFVAAGEQGRVAHHTVQNQTFIGFGLRTLKRGAIVEIHVDGANLHLRARNFGGELERNAFIRLHAHSKDIGLNLPVSFTVFEDHERRLFELDSDFGQTFGQVFTGTKVEWYAGPPPVVNENLQGDISFGGGSWRDPFLIGIARNLFASYPAWAILGADGVGHYIPTSQMLQGM